MESILTKWAAMSAAQRQEEPVAASGKTPDERESPSETPPTASASARQNAASPPIAAVHMADDRNAPPAAVDAFSNDAPSNTPNTPDGGSQSNVGAASAGDAGFSHVSASDGNAGSGHTDAFASAKRSRVWIDKNRLLRILGVFAALLITIFAFLPDGGDRPEDAKDSSDSKSAEVEKLLFAEETIQLPPGGSYQLATAILPREASDALLTYESADPDILFVSEAGIVTAGSHWNPDNLETTEVIVHAENGVSARLPVTVNDARVSGAIDYSEKYADMIVSVQVRKTRDEPWAETITAEPGDTVDCLIRYENAAGRPLEQLLVKSILPESMDYMEGTTKTTGADHPDGALATADTLTGVGIDPGVYSPESVSFVQFQARIVDDNLEQGENPQYLWGQVRAGSITRQSRACVIVNR